MNITLQEAQELDKKLDQYIVRTIYFAKNKRLTPYQYDEAYGKLTKNFDLGKLPLENLWNYSASCPTGIDQNKLYSKLQDAKISLVMVMQHFYAFVVANNAYISASIEDHMVIYRMEMYNQLVSFILGYRALWDKFMNTLVYLFYPEKCSAGDWAGKSRKGSFKKIFSSSPIWPKIEGYIGNLDNFDNQYRTPEAHFEGRMKAYILFSEDLPSKQKMILDLIYQHFNTLMEFLSVFEQLLSYAKTQDPADLEQVHTQTTSQVG